MTQPTTIRVTADHIAKGEKRTADACPIALAVRAIWPGPVDAVRVQWRWMDVYDGDSDNWTLAYLPVAAQDFIEDFDEGSPVEPFEFAVEWINQDGGPS